MWNTILFAVIPYLAVVIAVLGGIWRYRTDRFSYTNQSSQFLERRALFWGSTAWHYGILLVLGAHVLAMVIWEPWASLTANPTRLYVLEVIGLALTLLALAGLLVLFVRRMVVPRVTSVTSLADWLLLLVLVAQVALGLWIGVGYRWGSEWYVQTAVPWLHSLFKLNPKTEYVAVLPDVVRVHTVLGFALVALFPFTRLVHVVTFPVTYLWRSYQVVLWNRRPGAARP